MPSKRQMDVWQGAIRMAGYGPARARILRKQNQRYLKSLRYYILGATKMLGELKIIDEFADKFDFRMFGPALLEKEVSWPVDYNGNPMLFFMGLPANLLNKKLDINLYCNIFITYDHEDDQHLYDLSDKNPEPNKSSCVILSDIRSSKVKKQAVSNLAKNFQSVSLVMRYHTGYKILFRNQICHFNFKYMQER